MNRYFGTSAGGTRVAFNGTNFGSDASVTLAGVTCALNYSDIGQYRKQHLCEWDGVDCTGLGVTLSSNGYDDQVLCLTNPADNTFDMYQTRPLLYVAPNGYAWMTQQTQPSPQLTWSYADLWSSKTSWGGHPIPQEGDAIVIDPNVHIFLDISPPKLHTILVYGTLEFSRDHGALALNVSYLFVKGGRLVIGTEEEPYMQQATITLEGNRLSRELPVYGAKVLAIRGGTIDFHGEPRVSWVRLAQEVNYSETSIIVDERVDWRQGDEIIITSTEYDQLMTDICVVDYVSSSGLNISLKTPLRFMHRGGWTSDDGRYKIPKYAAAVGLLTRNIVVRGDDSSKNGQFGGQMVFSTGQSHISQLNVLVVRLSNVKTRLMGQGLKLGKYPIHFHLAGSLGLSYVSNCSVHTSFNRGIALHGVHNLRVNHNVVFNTRGHTIFIEDGTETGNTIHHNLVSVVRPVWSLLTVDMSPSAFWIVNPNNTVTDNVAAGSTHYGFWFRALEKPDGISGEAANSRNQLICPSMTPLGVFRGNTAHSTVKHGLKISDYFPSKGGASCQKQVVPEEAIFQDFTAFKNGMFVVWGIFMVSVSFHDLRVADHMVAGYEMAWQNGKGAEFGRSSVTNAVFVGRAFTPKVQMDFYDTCKPGDHGHTNAYQGCYAPICLDDRRCHHGISLAQLSSNIIFQNITFVNYQAAIHVGAWGTTHRGGY